MCEGGFLDILGDVVSVVGGIQSSRAESKAIRRQAEVTRQAADFELARLGEETEALRSRQRVAFAKSGVTQTGSVLDVQTQTAEDAELEALNIQFGAGAGVQSRLFEARQARTAGVVRAAGTILTGAARRAR